MATENNMKHYQSFFFGFLFSFNLIPFLQTYFVLGSFIWISLHRKVNMRKLYSL